MFLLLGIADLFFNHRKIHVMYYIYLLDLLRVCIDDIANIDINSSYIYNI